MSKALRKTQHGFTLIELMIVVAIVGVLAVLAIYGVRKYIANAKTAEAKNSLGQIGADAATALERENMSPSVVATGGVVSGTRRLCLSASATVPSAAASIQGKKYQSNPGTTADWNVDSTTTGKGFSCLKFEMTSPQYFMYNYGSDATTSTVGTAMSATANGDLNGDGTLSTFQLLGAITAGSLRLSPSVSEVNPEE